MINYMGEIAGLFNLDFNQPFNIVYSNNKKDIETYILTENGLFAKSGRPTPYVLINILTGRAAIIKE